MAQGAGDEGEGGGAFERNPGLTFLLDQMDITMGRLRKRRPKSLDGPLSSKKRKLNIMNVDTPNGHVSNNETRVKRMKLKDVTPELTSLEPAPVDTAVENMDNDDVPDGKAKSELVYDLKLMVLGHLQQSLALERMGKINPEWQEAVDYCLQSWNKKGSYVDLHEYILNENPFSLVFYDHEKPSPEAQSHYLARVRKLISSLEYLTNERNITSLDGLCPLGLNVYTVAETTLPQLSVKMQEKIINYIGDFVNLTTFKFTSVFYSPEMFLRCISLRTDKITVLDLGHLEEDENVGSSLNELFKQLVSLEDLTWNTATIETLASLPKPHKVNSLYVSLPGTTLTLNMGNTLSYFQGLEKVFIGMEVPYNPTRFDLEVVLSAYQHLFNNRVYKPAELRELPEFEAIPTGNGKERDYLLQSWTNVKRLIFWQAPEKIFIILALRELKVKTLAFGLLSPEHQHLCSFDSLLSALMAFDLNTLPGKNVLVRKIRLRLHPMRLVSLGYYLPNLMDQIDKKLWFAREVDLFVHSLPEMESDMKDSWTITAPNRNRRKTLQTQMTHFSLHFNGYAVLENLDWCLPSSLEYLSISLDLPMDRKKRELDTVVSSLVKLITRLTDLNAFPELKSLHIQVWGVRCAEILLNTIADHMSYLKHLSVIAMPRNENRDRLMDLLRHVVSSFADLETFSLSKDMLEFLFRESELLELSKSNWRLALALLHEKLGMKDCEINVGELPELAPREIYKVVPKYPFVIDENSDSEEEECEEHINDFAMKKGIRFDDDESSEDEHDSFVCTDGEVEMETSRNTDELDALELKLEGESQRREKRAMRKLHRLQAFESSSESEPEPSSESEEEDEEEIERRYKERAKFFDDEAEEDEDEENSEDDEFLDRSESSDKPRNSQSQRSHRRRIDSASHDEGENLQDNESHVKPKQGKPKVQHTAKNKKNHVIDSDESSGSDEESSFLNRHASEHDEDESEYESDVEDNLRDGGEEHVIETESDDSDDPRVRDWDILASQKEKKKMSKRKIILSESD